MRFVSFISPLSHFYFLSKTLIVWNSFFIAYDQTDTGLADQKAVLDVLVHQEGSLARVAKRVEDAAHFLLGRDSYFLSGKIVKTVDVAHVLKMIPIHWVAGEIVSSELLFLNPFCSFVHGYFKCVVGGYHVEV